MTGVTNKWAAAICDWTKAHICLGEDVEESSQVRGHFESSFAINLARFLLRGLSAHLFKEELPSTTSAKTASRRAALQRFKEKKRLRAEAPTASVKYKARKVIADSRPRFKGRFVACRDV